MKKRIFNTNTFSEIFGSIKRSTNRNYLKLHRLLYVLVIEYINAKHFYIFNITRTFTFSII